ncbi:MAG: FAD-dependent oxidoreductase [Clostridia bacterium]|nr:FAD-dependent oxidoreductase [Clostridia bacterium]
MYDIIIVGGGPAGLTAAIYAGRANKSVLIIEKDGFGGQMTHSPKIENYPGFKEISGNELADLMLEQALALGADIEIDEVTSISGGKIKKVKTELSEYEGRAVIIAAGVKHRTLGAPGEEEHIGNGISFCAVCDGAFYAGKDVAVIGGGNSAMQEAIMLSELCGSITMIQDMPYLTGEAALASIIESKPNIKVLTGSKVISFEGGDEGLTGVKILQNGTEKTVPCGGCFIAIGLIPSNEAAADVAELDKYGYIVSDEKCLTKSEGIFAAGDCRTKSVRQITTAASDGATAALAACRYIEGR